jgi:tetratricopeptide (TPR) repeat protein
LPQTQSNPSRALKRARRACADGELGKAERLCGEALARHPDSFDALHCLGEINYKRGRLDAALTWFQEALKRDIARGDGFASLGSVFQSLGQFERALVAYDEGLRLSPNETDLLNRRGVVLLEIGRWGEALQIFERVAAADPDNTDALGNYGNALFKLNRPGEAIAVYDRALARAPGNAQLLTNRAIALRRLDRPHEALASVTRALAASANFAPARFVDAAVRLTLGDFSAGWRGYEARWGGALSAQRRNFTAPLWLGQEPLNGKTILLHAEQGFGDTIQFVRYAPLVAARGAEVVLEVQPQLVRLVEGTAGLFGVTRVVARGAALPPFDCHCPLLSLPLAFATDLTNIPAHVPYLAPADADIAAWRARLPPRRGRLRVGLAWSGARAHDNDINRSLQLATLAPLFDLADIDFVSLQHEVRQEDAALLHSRSDIARVGQDFRDFADTAAALASLDAVIAVDTAVAHLAGAMGKPLYLLLPFAADFRWLRERGDSPWYPSARLFRQPGFGDWHGAIMALRAALQ